MSTVALIGLGLTGSAIALYLLQHRQDLPIVMAGAGFASTKAGLDLGALVGLPACGVPVTPAEQIPAALMRYRPQVVIDFSRADATLGLLRYYAHIHCGVVVGTTGFSELEYAQLRRAPASGRFGLLHAPNITRGVNVLMLLARLAAQYLPEYDIEVIERHHRRKKDAPSGTAEKIVNQLCDVRQTAVTVQYGRKGSEARLSGEIGIHAVRGGGIVGVHEVLLAGEYDEITITHRSESRLAFAAGAADAAAWIAHRRGFYTMDDLVRSSEVDDVLSVTASLPLPSTTGIAV